MTPIKGQTVAEYVVDKAALKLRSQVDAVAPRRRKDSDGTIGDPAHAARVSAHNPEDSEDATAPGNPDNQVDAVDITHDPANGCDIGVFWENIRASRDMRAKFFIFNRRCFSNYNHSEGDAFTWRPYRGENPHDKHGHGEIDDRYHDQTHDWKIGNTMQWTDKLIRETGNKNRTHDDVDADLSNLRDYLVSKPGVVTVAPPAEGSRIDLIVDAAQKILTAPPVTVTMTQADREEIARLIVEQLGALRFVPMA